MQAVEIIYNEAKNGIELLFKEPVSDTDAEHLKASGFAQAQQEPLKWWAKQHPAFVHFAKKLYQALLKNAAIDSVLIQPSFHPSEDNLDKNRFSLVTLRYSKGTEEVEENHIVFDPFKVVAEAVASRFGQDKFGSAFKGVTATPRKQKNKARELFQKGFIITGQPVKQPEEIDPEAETSPQDPRANENGVYTKETAGAYLEEIDIPFPKSAKFYASVSIAQGSDGKYRYGIWIENRADGFSGLSFAPSVNSKSFNSREEALDAALSYILFRSELSPSARKALIDYINKLWDETPVLKENPKTSTVEGTAAILQTFDELHAAAKYDEAADVLIPLLNDLTWGHNLEFFTAALERALRKGMVSALRNAEFPPISSIILNQQFLEALKQNLWELIPAAYKTTELPAAIEWKASPQDAGLQKIAGPFTSTDRFNANTLGVAFIEKGIAATDRTKLIFIPESRHSFYGLYCMTPMCFAVITGTAKDFTDINLEDKERLEHYRLHYKPLDYEAMIPPRAERIVPVDVQSLYAFVEGLRKTRLLAEDHRPVLLKLGEEFICIDARNLRYGLEALLYLGLTQLEMGYHDPLRPLIFAGSGKVAEVHTMKHPFVILVPIVASIAFGRTVPLQGDIYFDLELSRPLTLGIEAKELPPAPHSDDPQANAEGYYLQEQAGSNWEDIQLPFPKTLKFEATLSIVKGADAAYRYGAVIKNDGKDYSWHNHHPRIQGEKFETRKEAIRAGIKYILNYSKTPEKAHAGIHKFAQTQGVEIDLPELPTSFEEANKYLTELGFSGIFSATDALEKPHIVVDLQARWYDNYAYFTDHIETPATKAIKAWEKEIGELKKDKSEEAKARGRELNQLIREKAQETARRYAFLDIENQFFQAELAEYLVKRAESMGYFLANEDERSRFTEESYYNQPIPEITDKLIRDFFKTDDSETVPTNGKTELEADHPIYDTEAWQMTSLEYQQMKAIEKTGHTYVLDANDRRIHEALVRQALDEGKEIPERVLQEYSWLKETHSREADQTGTTTPAAGEVTDSRFSYLDQVIAHIHDMFSEGKRPTKGQIEKLASELHVPNMGMMWEAVELSWLLWYKMLYKQQAAFEVRLAQMIRFWNKQQPTYAYSDSSKELYRQYSTPCPVGAIIAQYTGMDKAEKIFEPSAGNGLFLVGADTRKAHVNEIDPTRHASLEFQGFAQITRYNAAEPFPAEMKKTFDVVVTNPPFSQWEETAFDKKRIIREYFNGQLGLEAIRLEHLMAGLALDTLKDEGRAAIIIMGHIYFDANGYIAKYRAYFNWLYRHYHVDDVINLNGFKLYNKQGAIEKTMLILIRGRKENPDGVAPLQNQAPWLYDMVDSFETLWQRVSGHLGYDIDTVIKQLQTELKKR